MAKIDVIYVEEAVRSHPRVTEIIERVRPKHVVECEHYGEIFNRKRQDFREQKIRSSFDPRRKIGTPSFGCSRGLWDWRQKEFLFLAHAQLRLRLPLLFSRDVPLSPLCLIFKL